MEATGVMRRGPTPWWQDTGMMGAANQNLKQSTPPGYTWDPVQMSYVPSVGSAEDAVRKQNREESFQDSDRQQRNQALSRLTSAISGLGSSSGGGSSFGSVDGFGGGAPAQVSRSTGNIANQENASRDAIFARAKDTAGMTAQSAMQGLQGSLQARGMGGAGYEAGQIGATLGRTASGLGGVSQMQAENELGQAQHVADEQYHGDISQRGQNITAQGQQLQARQAQAALAQQKQLALTQMLGGMGVKY